MREITIDKDIVDSLRGLFFGSSTDIFGSIALRAYRDFNRTLSLGTLSKEHRLQLRLKATECLRDNYNWLMAQTAEIQSGDQFDEWHRSLALNLIRIYEEDGISFSYGQAQKWINMTAKYIYLAGEFDFVGIFGFLHIPIDNYIMDIAESKLGIEKPKQPWSRWCYEQYKSYQDSLMGTLANQGQEPLRWEFRNWLEAARGVDDEDGDDERKEL